MDFCQGTLAQTTSIREFVHKVYVSGIPYAAQQKERVISQANSEHQKIVTDGLSGYLRLHGQG